MYILQMRVSLSILFYFFSTIALFAQFTPCQSPTIHDLNDVYFVNAIVGYAVGEQGTILKTIDGGESWEIQMEANNVSFKRVRFFDQDNGIALGSEIYTTADGGERWVYRTTIVDSFFDIAVLSNSACLLGTANHGVIRSDDFGVTWDTSYSNMKETAFTSIHFVNNQIGFAASSNGATIESTFRSVDAGRTWTKHEDETGLFITLLEDICFIDENTGFRGGWYGPHLMRTEDKGLNWTEVLLPDTAAIFGFGIYDIQLVPNSTNILYACGWYGQIFKSIDAGLSWNLLEVEGGSNTIYYGNYFIDEKTGWVVGANGTILKTNNGGVAVTTLEPRPNLEFLVFPNPTSDIINIVNEQRDERINYRLLDINGKRLADGFVVDNKINIMGLIPGIYLLELRVGNKILLEKIIKE